MWSEQTIRLIEAAFDEDLGSAGDLTSALLAEADAPVVGHIVPRANGLICGLSLAPQICEVFSRRLTRLEGASSNAPYVPCVLDFSPAPRGDRCFQDSDAITAGRCVATLRGPRSAVLAVERTLLNFLGRMSGVATLTHRFVDTARAANPKVRVCDTRKTMPGWRELDKYAVRCGGGHSHRMGLYDAVLIKDNHLAGIPTERLAHTLSEMLNRVQGHASFVEVEVDNLTQLAEVCKAVGVNLVLLDNFTPEQMRQAVQYREQQGLCGKLELEASGGVTLENVAEIAATGVDRIAVGALTHSAPALDITLDLEADR